MKAFEKWIEAFNIDGGNRKIYGNLPIELMKQAWRAALEWYQYTMGEESEVIEQELESRDR